MIPVYTFSEKPPGIYRFVTLHLENNFHPLRILQNCVTPLVGGNSFQVKKPRPMEILRVFHEHPWKFYFFFNGPLEFPHVFSLISLKNRSQPTLSPV